MKCPSLTNLLDYLRGHLRADERVAIREHISRGCPSCQENQRWLEEVLRLTSEDKSFTFPEEVIQKVIAEFKDRSTPFRSPLRQLFTRLIFDSLTSQQPANVRFDPAIGGAVAERQMLFQSEDYDIDLRFEQAAEPGIEEMIGQVLPRQQRAQDLIGFSAQLFQGEVEVDHAQIDARGIFKFAGVLSGIYDLKIQVPEGEIYVRGMATAHAP